MSDPIFFVYKTINMINNKFYIDKHKTTNKNDGYLGSGVLLKRAIEKYGRENFKREILCFCQNEEELNATERQLVSDLIVEDTLSYNLIKGGTGGDARNFSRNISSKKLAEKAAATIKSRPDVLASRNRKIGNATRARYLTNPKSFVGGLSNKDKRKETDVGIQKQIESRRVRTNQIHAEWLENVKTGINNKLSVKQISSQFGMSISTVYRVLSKLKELS